LTWNAINAVRHVGNIGARMQLEVDLIIDVEPDEAQLLINLIEYLFEDFYIARHDKQEKLNKLVQLGQDKNPKKTRRPLRSTSNYVKRGVFTVVDRFLHISII
jgi:hypothetical protein